MKLRLLLPLIALGVAPIPGAAEPAIQLSDPYDGGQTTNFQAQTFGWSFEVTAPVTITALGLFDFGSDGLFFDHEIGLWEEGGADPLLTGTVGAGDGNELDGSFRYVDVTPYALNVGTVYVLGAYYDGMLNGAFFDRDFLNNHLQDFGGSFGPQITFIEGLMGSQGIDSLVYPDQSANGVSPQLGPTFRYEPTVLSVPDGGVGHLFALCLLGLLGLARRRCVLVRAA